MQIIENLGASNHLEKIKNLISKYEIILLCSGWVKIKGVKLISESLKHAVERGALISVASNEKHTDKKSIELFRKLKIKHAIIKKSDEVKYFHTKLYYFEGNGEYTYIIGSANITEGALVANEELSVCISGITGDQNHKKIQPYIEYIRNAYFA